MKWFALLLFIPTSLLAQYARMEFQLQNAQGQAISGANVTVFNQAACGSPATSQATLYHNAQGTGSPVQQPLKTDGFGQAYAYAAPGCYTTIYVSSQTGTITRPDQIIGGNGPQGAQGVPGPPGGVANITPSPQFTMMYQPLAGTQSAAQGDPGITSDGSGALQARTGFGTRIASQWQTPPLSGNNGIANASASGQTVVADPSYGNTEYYSWLTSFQASTHPWGPATVQSHVQDYRNGTFIDTYRDPPVSLFDSSNTAYTLNLQSLLQQGNTTFGRPGAMKIYSNFWAPGVSMGTAAVGPTNWTTGTSLAVNQSSATPGIHGGMAVSTYKTGIGDNVGAYFYNFSYGGATAGSDEGNHAVAWHGDENSTTFKGTVTTGGGGSGATTIHITCTADCNMANGGPGDGRYLVDQTTIDSGNATAIAAPVGSTPGQITIDHSITPSTAIGTLSGNCNAGAAPTPVGTGYNTVTCSVALVSGAFATGASPVCFNGGFHEQALISNITGAGPFSITMNLRHAHGNGTMIAQGGPCGTFINFTANDVSAVTVIHYPIDLIGAPDATHLYYSFFYLGSSLSTNIGSPVGGMGALSLGVFAVTNISNAGGTVYFTSALSTNVSQLAGGTMQISNTTNFNGPCTNSKWLPATNQYSCVQASSIGQPNEATASVTVGTSQYGNSGYVTWKGAEVLDVLDHSVNPPVVNNGGVFTLTTEPNNAAWANGAAVEEAHHYAQRLGTLGTAGSLNKMIGSSTGLSISVGSQACCGNFSAASSFTNSFPTLSLINSSSNGIYKYHGGYVSPPGGILLTGAGGGTGVFNYGLAMTFAPEPFGTPLVYAGCPASGCTDPFYYYYPFILQGNGGTGGLQYKPYGNEFATFGNWVWQSDFGKQTFRDSLIFAPLSTLPVLNTPTAIASGGSLLDATPYFYTVYAVNSAGNALQSVEKTVTTGTSGNNNSISLTWTRIQGAINYFVCRSTTTGTELKGPNISINAGATWLDTGATTFAGACATTDTSRGGIEQAGWLGANSSGTAFEMKIQAPASAAATYTVTGPETATTGSLVDKLAGATVVGHLASFTNVTGRIGDSGATLALTQPLYMPAEFDNGTCTTAKTIAAANGNKQKVLLTNAQTCALTFTQPASGTANISLKITQSSVSTFNGAISGGKWPAGLVPTITQTSAAVDFISCYLDGTNTYCVASQDFR